MNSFDGKVAVITGAASGIGFGLAERCVQEGMKVVLADIEPGILSEAAEKLAAAGGQVLAVKTDVSKQQDVAALAQQTLDAFGAVHFVANNAGVSGGSTVWGSTEADWSWVMGVNLWGVIYGVQVFVPIMLSQGTEGHIVNTASLAGLTLYGTSAPYQVTKHAVVGLTEHLYYSLKEQKALIGASVLCPAWVKTRIVDSERNRPESLQNKTADYEDDPAHQARIEQIHQFVESGISPVEVADRVFKGVEENRLYILTHPEFNVEINRRFRKILE